MSEAAVGPGSHYEPAIFAVRGMAEERLSGSVYRYWCAHAVAYLLGRHLHGSVDFLDAGGRDGHILETLHHLGLSGTYTCLDLEPAVKIGQRGGFRVESIRGSFEGFVPPRPYDAVLFENSLECVADVRSVGWLQPGLKPGGKVFVTMVTRGARSLYPGFWAAGGRHYRNHDELGPTFKTIGLRVVECVALVGLSGRAAQYVFQQKAGPLLSLACARTLGRLGLVAADPVRSLNRLVNLATARVDRRLLSYRPVGHCLVLERDPMASDRKEE